MTRKKISDVEQKLWDTVTKSVTPLEDRAKNTASPHTPQKNLIRRQSHQPQTMTTLPAEWLIQSNPTTTQASVPRATLDKHNRRQLKSARRPIDHTLDLHGLSQDAAHRALKHCLETSAVQGLRTILVVTGKGGKRWTQTGDKPISQRRRRDFEPHGGILKRMVPLWLAAADLAPLVHSYSEASQKDGGAGALYILLRRLGHKYKIKGKKGRA